MKCLMLKQPWAYLVATGVKTIETRTWRTKYRGPLAIAASQAYDLHGGRYLRDRSILFPAPYELVRGAVVATATLRDVVAYTPELVPQGLCPHTEGEERYGWLLEDIQMLAQTVPVKGRLGLFDITWP
ncbi:MAG: ASCH domain-containing protein [Elusimicrobia bacterium]|nr:ASCH domain-containing protein [Elusimicrobiota bacterium]